MNGFETIFEISSDANGVFSNAMLRMGIGIIMLFFGVIGLTNRIKDGEKFGKKYYAPAFITFWSVVWLLGHIPFLLIGTTKTKSLLETYKTGNCQTVEGIVEVLHEQPSGGHDAGDKIKIGTETFTIDYYTITPAYKETISHGGALKQGVYARLHYSGDYILKVEVK